MSNLDLGAWLKSQLTSTKKNEIPWTELAQSIGDVMNLHIETIVDRIRQRSSLYEMQKKDIIEETKELRSIFPFGEIVDDDFAHAISQRRDEIHFKRTEYPLSATIAREFGGMEVKWSRLYAPVDQDVYPYGELFIQEGTIKYSQFDMSELFLTSRGVIDVPANLVQLVRPSDDTSFEEFEAEIERIVYPLLPLRIVFDGVVYSIHFDFTDTLESLSMRDNVDAYFKDMEQFNDGIKPSKYEADTKITTTEVGIKRYVAQNVSPRMCAVSLDAIRLDRAYN